MLPYRVRKKKDYYTTGGRIYNTQGYILLWMPHHANADKHGYVREHVVVMTAFLGRPLIFGETVHHINHIRDDNRIENLQLFDSHSDHMKAYNHKKVDWNNYFCSKCGSKDTYKHKNTPHWFKDGNGGHHCATCYESLSYRKRVKNLHYTSPM